MAERYFIAKEARLYVDLDTVTLCQQKHGGWVFGRRGNANEWIDDDATGAALLAALAAWRAAHPEPGQQAPTTPYPPVYPAPVVIPTDRGPSDWPPATPVWSEPHTGDPLPRPPSVTCDSGEARE
ncbi:MAG: hypothetical protein WC683_08130 [bacterium]